MILSKFKLIQVYSGYQLVFVWFLKMFYHVLLLQNLKAKNQALQASITPRWSSWQPMGGLSVYCFKLTVHAVGATMKLQCEQVNVTTFVPMATT